MSIIRLVAQLVDAGGVGALLQMTDHASGKGYFPTYDGNGNVISMLNAETGAIAAAYEYSPFGEQIRAHALDATIVDNSWRFSTKFTDLETGLVCYGFRFFDPKSGRFINRDPSGDNGGGNHYGFALNNPACAYDVLGLYPVTILGKPYDIIAIPAVIFNPSAPGALASYGAVDWSWSPSKWGVSINVFYSSTTGFGTSIAPSSYIFLQIPLGPVAPKPVAPPPQVIAPSGPVFAASGALAAALDRMFPSNPMHYRIAVLYDGASVAQPFAAAPMSGGLDFTATSIGLREARPGLYFGVSNVATYSKLYDAMTESIFSNWGGMIILDHGIGDIGPMINGTPINEAMIQHMSLSLAVNGPRVIMFGMCEAFQYNQVVAQYQAWAIKYNLTFIAANMAVSASIGNNPSTKFQPQLWTYYGIDPAHQDAGFNWVRVSPDGITYFNPDGSPVPPPQLPPNEPPSNVTHLNEL